jgi:hypothetical protein
VSLGASLASPTRPLTYQLSDSTSLIKIRK